MKLFSTLLLTLFTSTLLLAQTPKAKPAKPAVPAQPAKPKTPSAKPRAIITSDLDGRDLTFVAAALDLSKALNYLSTVAARTNNPNLRGFGETLVQSLRGQGVVLDAIAEMRKVKVGEGESSAQKKWSDKLEKLAGPRLEKTLLDAFIEIDTQLIAVYESGTKSSDQAIRSLVEQSLPPARKHLDLLESMAGIGSKTGFTSARPASIPPPMPAPKLPPVAEQPAPTPPATPLAPTLVPDAPLAQPAPQPPDRVKKKPAFRTHIPLPEGQL